MNATTHELRARNLLAMSRRLAEAISADLAALKQAGSAPLATLDPEIERTLAAYGRDIQAMKAGDGLKGLPSDLLASLREAGIQLKTLLGRHERHLSAARETSEGLVKAVADEAMKNRQSGAPYTPAAPDARPRDISPLVYNAVV